jgi:hypothetical protein
MMRRYATILAMNVSPKTRLPVANPTVKSIVPLRSQKATSSPIMRHDEMTTKR